MTFHVWASRVADLDRPDFVLFDLDPGKAPFANVIEVARGIKAALDESGAEAFAKTSGKSGLHVLTPWAQDGGFDEARAWALELARRTAKTRPGLATVEIRKVNRGGRVYIEVLQNARGHHAVPPYVLRAVPRATISTPLSWRELTDDLDAASYTPRTSFRHLARQARDPMAGLLPEASARRARRPSKPAKSWSTPPA